MTDHHLAPRPDDRVPAEAPAHQASAYSAEPRWPAEDGEDGGFDWRDQVAVLVRYKWIVVLAILLGAGGAYYMWETVTVEPEYTAAGSLWVQSDGSDRGPIVTDGLFQAASWLDLIRSYSVIDPVVEQEKLYLTTARADDLSLFDDFQLEENFERGTYRLRVSENGSQITLHRDRGEVDRGAPGNTLGAPVGFRWVTPSAGFTPGQEVTFYITTPRNAANRLRSELILEMDRQSTFLRVALRSREQERSAAIVNGIMDRHVALAAELKGGNLDEQAEILEEQLSQVERELREAERALEEFRITTITLPSEGTTVVQPGLEMTSGSAYDDFFRTQVEQDQVRRDRERVEEYLAFLPERGFQVDAVQLIAAVRNASEIQESINALVSARSELRTMLEVYTPEHPPARDLADRIERLETERLPQLLSRLAVQLREEEDALGRRIESSGASLSEIPPRAIEEQRLRHRVAIQEDLYTELRRRYETANLARASSSPDIRVLDYAGIPESPPVDPRAQFAAMTFLGFLGGGLLIALVLGKLDPRLRNPNEIPQAIGLNVLGAIPRIRRGGAGKGGNVDQVHEAFRDLRTNLSYAFGAAGPLVVTISSPSMNEGKTLVSTNLGIAFAALGRHTIVVDADTRRGDLHHYLGGDRKPGLTDYLQSKVSEGELVQKTPYDGLHFIGSGTQVANSPELIGTHRMSELMGVLKGEFDVIIIDSPPLGAGPDALVLASHAGHMMVVIRSGSTHKDFTRAKLEPLFRLPIRLLGVALNDYEPPVLSNHYARYYGSYLRGYEAGAEEGGNIKPARLISKPVAKR